MSDERSAGAIDKRLGERVRARRLEIGMSQEKLADLLGVTFQQVQKYEKGVNRIAASRLAAISGALEMSVSEFYEGLIENSRDPTSTPRSLDRALANPHAVELVVLYDTIKNQQVRKRVLELVRAMASEVE